MTLWRPNVPISIVHPMFTWKKVVKTERESTSCSIWGIPQSNSMGAFTG